MGYLLAALREPQPLGVVNGTGVPLLTKGEMAVVKCVAEGLTNREAAAQLNLNEHRVKNYMFRIFDKLGVSSRVELVLYVASQLQSGPSLNGSGAAKEGSVKLDVGIKGSAQARHNIRVGNHIGLFEIVCEVKTRQRSTDRCTRDPSQRDPSPSQRYFQPSASSTIQARVPLAPVGRVCQAQGSGLGPR